MKRWTVLCIALILMLAAAACSSSSGTEPQESGQPAGKKVLYVSSATENDTVVVKRLQKMGFEVYESMDVGITVDAAEGVDLIVIGNSSAHGRIAGTFKQSPIPQLVLKSSYSYVVGTAGSQKDTGAIEYQTKITIKDGSHPLAAGLSGTVDVYKVGGKIGYVKPGKGANIIAVAAEDETRATIFAYEKGAKDATPFETPLPARQVFFYLMGGEETNQTDDSWKLFEAAVNYAVETPKQ